MHVIDASDPNHEEHEKVVLDILKDLDMTDIPRLAIYNKMDVADNLVATVFPNVRLSARDKGSREALRRLLIDEIQQIFEPFSIKVHQDQAYKLYQLSQLALLDSYTFETEVEEITGYISPKINGNWKNFMTDYMDLALKYGGFTSLDKVYLKNTLSDLSDSQKFGLHYATTKRD